MSGSKRTKRLLSGIMSGAVFLNSFVWSPFNFGKNQANALSVVETLQQNNKIVLGYWCDWLSYPASDIPWDSLTHINYAFAKCDGQGKLDGYNEIKVQQLTAARDANNPNTKLLLSVGGVNWSTGTNGGEYFSALMRAGESSWIAFADNCIDFLKTYGFDGIDIDYEFPSTNNWQGKPTAEDRDNFPKFLKVLDDKLNAVNPGYLLTTAGSAGDYVLKGMAAGWQNYFDFINIMTYDLCNWEGTASHNSPIYSDGYGDASIDSAVSFYVNTLGYPANKLVVGAPYYSYSWTGATKLGAKGQMSDDEVALPIVKQIVENNPSSYHWDDKSKVPYVVYNDTFYSYEDTSSIQAKIDYVKEKGLAGMMSWHLGGDPAGAFSKQISSDLYNFVGGTDSPDVTTSGSNPATTTAGSNPATTTAGNTTSYPNWEDIFDDGSYSKAIINIGDRVVYDGNIYEATINMYGKRNVTEEGWILIGSVDTETTTASTTAPTGYTEATTATTSAPLSTTDNYIADMNLRNRVNVGYYNNWGGQSIENIQWGYLTHICYAFTTSYLNGVEAKMNGQSIDGQLRSLAETRDRKAPDTKLLISVGGASASNDFHILMTKGESEWQNFADTAVEFLETYNFQGIDIDYECPSKTGWAGGNANANTYTNFVKFMKILRDTLDKADKGYLLTCAASPSIWVLADMSASEYCQYLDYMFIMTYDLADPGKETAVNHDSPLYPNPAQANFYLSCDYGITYLMGAMPPEKIVLGTPLYSGGGSYKNMAKSNPAVMHDEISKTAYTASGDFGDFWSIEERVKYVEEKGIAGIMYWDTPQDIEGDGSLIKHAGKELAKISAINKTSYPFTSTNELANFSWLSRNPDNAGASYDVIITNNTGSAWNAGTEIEFTSSKIAAKNGGFINITANGFQQNGQTKEELIFKGTLASSVVNGATYTISITCSEDIPAAVHEFKIGGKYSAPEFLLEAGGTIPEQTTETTTSTTLETTTSTTLETTTATTTTTGEITFPTQATTTITSNSLKGDLNNDENVNTTDLTVMKRIVAKWAVYLAADYMEAGELNKDTAINTSDLTILKRSVAKWAEYLDLEAFYNAS